MIEFKIKTEPVILVGKIQEKLKEFDGSLSGNDKHGSLSLDIQFAGVFKGTYLFVKREGETFIQLTITDKPSIVTEGLAQFHLKRIVADLDK